MREFPAETEDDGSFVDEIVAKIRELKIRDGHVRISVADKLCLEKFDQGLAWVRWVCWSINDPEGGELVEPVYQVCAPCVTQELIRKDLGCSLGGLKLDIDNDIQPDGEG
jgi:hypothetical protein